MRSFCCVCNTTLWADSHITKYWSVAISDTQSGKWWIITLFQIALSTHFWKECPNEEDNQTPEYNFHYKTHFIRRTCQESVGHWMTLLQRLQDAMCVVSSVMLKGAPERENKHHVCLCTVNRLQYVITCRLSVQGKQTHIGIFEV